MAAAENASGCKSCNGRTENGAVTRSAAQAGGGAAPAAPSTRAENAFSQFSLTAPYTEQSASVDSEPFPTTDQVKRYQTKQSPPLPPWAWNCLGILLGVSSAGQARHPLGTLLFALTILTATLFGVLKFVYIAYDVASTNTAATVLDGLLICATGLSWLCIAIYSNRLAANLMVHPKLLDGVRLHAKSIFKINSLLLSALLATCFLVVHNYNTAEEYGDAYCQFVSLHPLVCKIMYTSRCIFSGFSLLWNLLIAFFVLSCCRSHTIGVRRFVRELEMDGRMVEWRYWADNAVNNSVNEPLQDSRGSGAVAPPADTSGVGMENSTAVNTDNMQEFDEDDDDEDIDWNDAILNKVMNRQRSDSNRKLMRSYQNDIDRLNPGRAHMTAAPFQQPSITDSLPRRQMLHESPEQLSIAEFLLTYWKLLNRLRLTSLALQRWLASWILIILLWSALFIIYWLSHTATAFDITEFVIPLLLLLLICSSFAEVNQEGWRVPQAFCPNRERATLYVYLTRAPMQMALFGLPLTYGTIVQVFVALAIAVASRVVLNMVTSPNHYNNVLSPPTNMSNITPTPLPT